MLYKRDQDTYCSRVPQPSTGICNPVNSLHLLRSHVQSGCTHEARARRREAKQYQQHQARRFYGHVGSRILSRSLTELRLVAFSRESNACSTRAYVRLDSAAEEVL